MELNTGKISSKVSQIYAVQQNKPLLLDEERHVFLSLPLETAKARWVLWLESEYALETLRGIPNADQVAFTLLFESELRKVEAGKPKPARLAAGEQEQAQAEPYRDTPEILLHGSAIMRRLLSHGRQIGATDAPVLILGETGVGKELLAHYIHDCSGRTGPFVPVHPASIPDGLFESEFFGHEKGAFTGAIRQKIGLAEMAHQGTLFIDEAGDIPAPMQIKLLRVLQEHEVMRVGDNRMISVDVRVIAATNERLGQLVEKGAFRQDLYYRLNTLPINLPPLRERKEDIIPLMESFQKELGSHFTLTAAAEAEFLKHDWNGNIRELRNYVEYFSYLDRPVIDVDALPPGFYQQVHRKTGITAPQTVTTSLRELAGKRLTEFRFILETLAESRQSGLTVGRDYLLEKGRNNNLILSQYEVREILATLEREQYVKISKGRGGTRITEKGLALLNEDLSTDLQ